MTHKFESAIEEAMGKLLDGIGIAYQTQVEVGKQKFGGQCRFWGYCEDKEESYLLDEDELPDCLSEGDDPYQYDESCQWYIPIKEYPLYRIDLVIEINNQKVALECDGYEYHKRNSQQMAGDTLKDKWLRDNGWIVRRFSGTYITRFPGKVKRDIQELVSELAKRSEPKQLGLL